MIATGKIDPKKAPGAMPDIKKAPSIVQRLQSGWNSFMSPSSYDAVTFSQLMPVYSDTGMRALMPEWYFQAPYGQPRRVDITEVRNLAQSPFIHVCKKTIIDDFATTDWAIVSKDVKDVNQDHIEEATNFFLNLNPNMETIQDIMRQWANDMLDVDAGVLVKVFDEKSYMPEDQMLDYQNQDTSRTYYNGKTTKEGFLEKKILVGGFVEMDNKVGQIKDTKKISLKDEQFEKMFRPLKPVGSRKMINLYCRDGATFLKDGDYTGIVHRWFQYSFKLPRRTPAVFDVGEIIYSCMSPRSYSFYGWSPIQSLEDVIRTLKEAVIYHLTGLTEKGVPDGIVSFPEGLSKDDLTRLQSYWGQEIYGVHHKFAVVNRPSAFTNLSVTSRDLEYLSTQQWFMRLVMAIFNIDIPVLSLRGEAPKAGSWAIIKRERTKAIIPLLQMFENIINSQILSEFPEWSDVEFKFQTTDIDEEKQKSDMDIADANAGIRTINEIRTDKGMDPVAWGDEPINLTLNTQFTGGYPSTQLPKSVEKEKPKLDDFGKMLTEVLKDA